ncbi:MAG: esterase [Clostridia bacterium]|nr:esterase [Clostridia bacterium]
MNIQYRKQFSQNLSRDMEYKIYGDSGKPMIALPSRGGRFYEFENNLLNVYAPYIERGDLQVFAVDEVDYEALAGTGDGRTRSERYEQWIKYIVDEAVPGFSDMNTAANGWKIRFALSGVAMGAMHAANLFFRYPDIFDAVMCLSGVYSCGYYFRDYEDDITERNSPVLFVKKTDEGSPLISRYRSSNIIFCAGQGTGERAAYESTQEMESVLKFRNIPARCEYWGGDSQHDFDWWNMQTAYFLPSLLRFD